MKIIAAQAKQHSASAVMYFLPSYEGSQNQHAGVTINYPYDGKRTMHMQEESQVFFLPQN